MKVLGGRLAPYWERFDRLQRTAAHLLGDRLGPKGVFRFKSHEDLEKWKTTHSRPLRVLPSRLT